MSATAHTPRSRGGASRSTGWRIARDIFPLGKCQFESCDDQATDHHHVDGDPLNNSPDNVATYCRRHHMAVDGRLVSLAARAAHVGKKGGRPLGTAPRRRSAEQFLTALLREQDAIPATRVRELATASGIAWRTLQEAKSELAIASYRRAGRWFWGQP